MEQLPTSITLTIALLTVFLSFVVVLKYAVIDEFIRTRIIMTSFFFFIVATITISFSEFTLLTLPFTIPSFLVGTILGYLIGVRAAEKRLSTEGVAHYMRHFMHVHLQSGEVQWWAFINFYSVMSALVLINMVGFSTVIFRHNALLAILTSVVGAFLIGTIVPYLAHLWTISAKHHTSSTTSDR